MDIYRKYSYSNVFNIFQSQIKIKYDFLEPFYKECFFCLFLFIVYKTKMNILYFESRSLEINMIDKTSP